MRVAPLHNLLVLTTHPEDGNPDVFDDKRINADKVAMIGHTLRIVRNFQMHDFNKKIKGKVTPLLKHLANIPRWSEEQLNAASEAIKPRKAIDDDTSGEPSSVLPSDDSNSDAVDVVRATLRSSCPLSSRCTFRTPQRQLRTRTRRTWWIFKLARRPTLMCTSLSRRHVSAPAKFLCDLFVGT